jgi:hypothetical protein
MLCTLLLDVPESAGIGCVFCLLQVIPVSCHLYDGTIVEAVTLQAAAASLHTGRSVLPSQRYLNLLQEGERLSHEASFIWHEAGLVT